MQKVNARAGINFDTVRIPKPTRRRDNLWAYDFKPCSYPKRPAGTEISIEVMFWDYNLQKSTAMAISDELVGKKPGENIPRK